MIAAIEIPWPTVATIILASGAGLLLAFAGVFTFFRFILAPRDGRSVAGSGEWEGA